MSIFNQTVLKYKQHLLFFIVQTVILKYFVFEAKLKEIFKSIVQFKELIFSITSVIMVSRQFILCGYHFAQYKITNQFKVS